MNFLRLKRYWTFRIQCILRGNKREKKTLSNDVRRGRLLSREQGGVESDRVAALDRKKVGRQNTFAGEGLKESRDHEPRGLEENLDGETKMRTDGVIRPRES